jgi:pimeloyl-ACP methyl ester carboxylesterase
MNVTRVAVDGVDLVVREWGEATGRPLVFWPGLNPFGSLVLSEVGLAWAERGFRVLAIAAPGAGETEALSHAEAYLPTRLATLVAHLATALDIDRFAFVGWSCGASIGVQLGAGHPELLSALVLIDAGHTDVELALGRDELVSALSAEQSAFSFGCWEDFDAAVPGLATARPSLRERFHAGMTERDGRIVVRADAEAAAWALHGVAAEPPSAAHAPLAAGATPILLVLASDNDTREAATRFGAVVPHAEQAEIAGGHDLFADAPEALASLVADWLLGDG